MQEVWEQKPQHVDTIRGQLSAAYRYVLEDVVGSEELTNAWNEARKRAQLYGHRRWNPIGPNFAVDDIQSPLIRQFLPMGKVTVASAHLGDTNDQVRRVATELGLGLLSNEFKVQQGTPTEDPAWIDRLWMLVETLASLEDRRALRKVEFSDALYLGIGNENHNINAYVEDGTLMLTGKPWTFAVEAAGQLVEYFQLSQRGTEVAWLTGALFALDDELGFRHRLQVLADGLGVNLKYGANQAATLEAVDPDGMVQLSKSGDGATDDVNGKNEGCDRTGDQPWRQRSSNVVQGGSEKGDKSYDSGETDSTRSKTPSPGDRAADQIRLLLVTRSGAEECGSHDINSSRGGKRDDRKARQAVIFYEKHHDRRAEAMDDNHPGFDVLSTDESTGHRRRIEVKGVKGFFEEDASVVLTARQVHDAVRHEEDGVEYWLYVVDSTETAYPRVFPIPWVQHRTYLRYGFYANVWAGDAEQPAIATETDITELSLEAMDSGGG